VATEISAKLRKGLEEIQSRYDVVERIAGEGLMIGAYFRPSESATLLKIQQKLLSNADKGVFGASVNVELFTKHRVIAQIPGPELNAIKILPPVNLTDADIAHFLESLDATLASMYKTGGPALPLGKAAVKDAFRQAKQKLIGGSSSVKK
jgi:acetylornithine/succinyldiaminopimelate/putrescine aminotransferase